METYTNCLISLGENQLFGPWALKKVIQKRCYFWYFKEWEKACLAERSSGSPAKCTCVQVLLNLWWIISQYIHGKWTKPWVENVLHIPNLLNTRTQQHSALGHLPVLVAAVLLEQSHQWFTHHLAIFMLWQLSCVVETEFVCTE